jgi:hypothetical protein
VRCMQEQRQSPDDQHFQPCAPRIVGTSPMMHQLAREANLTHLFKTTKEVCEGAVKPFEGGVHDHRRQFRMLFLAMPLILLVQMQRGACLLRVSDQLLKTGNLHLARGHQYVHQGLFLSPR